MGAGGEAEGRRKPPGRNQEALLEDWGKEGRVQGSPGAGRGRSLQRTSRDTSWAAGRAPAWPSELRSSVYAVVVDWRELAGLGPGCWQFRPTVDMGARSILESV